jgi:hypothetical protein
METKESTKFTSGLFEDQASAESAYNAAIKRGYKPDDINVLMTDDTRKKYYGSEIVKEKTGDKSLQGLALGGAIGGTALGLIGAVVALTSTIVIPGLGLVIAGPLAAGLVGAGAGSITGGILGALVGAGIPEERARIYENGLKKGGVVLVVKPKTENDALLKDWKANHGKDVF